MLGRPPMRCVVDSRRRAHAEEEYGRRASSFTDYTFAVPEDQGELKPIAKACSGLTDGEIRELDRWRRHADATSVDTLDDVRRLLDAGRPDPVMAAERS